MAEVQKTTVQSGQMSERFIEFVMMQSQQISLLLGRIPHPQTGQKSVMLEPARLFLDHLEMIREKTRGNLSTNESGILDNVLNDLQTAYAEAAKKPA